MKIFKIILGIFMTLFIIDFIDRYFIHGKKYSVIIIDKKGRE